ncbi:MAG: winged helix-turn-helix transcriptional regulator [archaeon]
MRFLIKESEARKKEVKLNVKDRKLIQLLVQNSRMGVSELAKRLQISKSAITQKIRALQEKGVLMAPVTYVSVKVEEKPFYFLQIATGLGQDTELTSQDLLSIEGVSAILWYNGSYNLLLGVFHEDIHQAIQEVGNYLTIKKLRIMRVTDNWFHSPHLFEEVADKGATFLRTNPKILSSDRKILNTLFENPRATLLEIAEKTRSAPITIKKRMEEMKKSGAIIQFSNYVNPWLCGKDIVSVHFSVLGRENIDKVIKKTSILASNRECMGA